MRDLDKVFEVFKDFADAVPSARRHLRYTDGDHKALDGIGIGCFNPDVLTATLDYCYSQGYPLLADPPQDYVFEVPGADLVIRINDFTPDAL